ncbi:MAG: DNA internalization-related competence protein ComEC/Rec2 [Marinobacter sp.]|uniref:DNA internalization-related competence protein ComEC/Rec2 n=1 Tax=Marinobacter sp. TaxID=50741 RepID=UPI00299EEE81|nr:DNA internalization-related competence protein ComEC/Rec2 [Marinobacter sp.]MDX1633036.1 DNA internalization-related competence protein ComEC/Rec2 [Marinobacter sp.]
MLAGMAATAVILAVIPPSQLRLPGLARYRMALFWLMLGLAWAGWHAFERLADRLPPALEGETLVVEGTLCSVPRPGIFDSVSFSLCVSHWPELDQPGPMPARLRLAWYGDDARLDLPERIRAKVRLKRPHGAVNPAGFRYESWLFRHGFRATGTVRELSPWPQGTCGLPCRFHQLRQGVAGWLLSHWQGTDHLALTEALLIGERGRMTPAHWQVLAATGTIHLVAISGLHIGLVALGVGLIARLALARLPQHWLAPRQRRLLVFALVAGSSLLYALAAGFTVPTRRAWLMVMMAAWLVFRAGRVASGSGWLLALALVLLMDPYAPLDRGFWLSFGAVAVLLLIFSGRLAAPSPVPALLLAQCAVFVGLWPALAVMDQTPAALGWLANLVAIPVLSLVVMPVLMLAALFTALVPAFAPWAGQAFDAVLGGLWWWLETVAGWPAPELRLAMPAIALTALAVMLLLVVPIPRARCLAMAVVLASGSGHVLDQASPGNRPVAVPEIWVLDVGQGLSVLLRHRDQVLVYDTGPETPSGYSAVDSILLPTLASLGVHRLQTLVISHGDRDHAGGLAQLLAARPVDALLAGEPERTAAMLTQARAVETCGPAQSRAVGDLQVTFWRAPGHESGQQNSNDASCVMTVNFGEIELVVPGDISTTVERLFLEGGFRNRAVRRILVAAHHGSKTSSGPGWVTAMAPEWVVYTAGYRHRYGHPHQDVVARFEAAGARGLNTATSGALRWRLLPEGPELTRWRDAAPFWIRPAAPVQ